MLGIIVAAPYPQFDKTRYHNPQYVRQYRTKMPQMLADDEAGFGIVIRGLSSALELGHLSMSAARSTCATTDGLSVATTANIDDEGHFSQRILLQNPTNTSLSVDYLVNLRLSVHRASYGQLTEGGPLLPPDCENRLRLSEDNAFSVSNHLLGGCLRGSLVSEGKPLALPGIQDDVDRRLVRRHHTNADDNDRARVTSSPRRTIQFVRNPP